MSISIYQVEGTIEPSASLLFSCRQSVSKGFTKSPPEFCIKEKICDLFEYGELQRNFEKYVMRDRLFWKTRTVTFLITSRYLHSMTWFPSDTSVCDILFIQKKKGQNTKISGFIAPYLCEEDKEKYGAEQEAPNYYFIQDNQTILQSILWVQESVRSQLDTALQYFVNDPTTSILTITFLNPHLVTAGWFKNTMRQNH